MEEERLEPIELEPSQNITKFLSTQVEVGQLAEEEARDFVKLHLTRRDGFCSQQHLGKMYVLENQHPTRKIGVMIEVTWRVQNQPRRETKAKLLLPGAELDLGCDVPGPTNQRFSRRVKTAWFD